ncbi:MBL fold metallo-hydrolase [Candidatus Woesearchaeota archaeon]|nr:MBL fold metallo-hydrolase [Candidatus Woesearchaeota archaeon]
MKLSFLGAARVVTGSCYLVEANGESVLVDCGMFQGRKETTRLNYRPFKFDPRKISHVFLTHAHIDHSGLIPKLVKEGFKGKIHTTSATIDLCRIMLEDSAYIQEKDTVYENKRREKKGLAPREPLYTQEDAENAMKSFEIIDYDEKVKISENITVRFRDAGHIIGSASIEMFVNDDGEDKKIVFSGDIGQWDVPIVKNPTLIGDADYVLIESTYGNRLHEGGMRDDMFLKYIKETYEKKGILMIPSFAIERTQELLYALNKFVKLKEMPDEKVFLDSPLAIKATEVFKKHRKFFDEEALTKYGSPFSFPNLVYSMKTEDSIRLNTYDKPCIIIAGSGMCTGGRIRHHFRNHISDPKNTVVFVGYQAEGTLGRYILEGAKKAKFMGIEKDIKADIRKVNAYSAHADYKELIKWMSGFKKKPKEVFIVHGEEDSAKALKSKLKKYNCRIPNLYEGVEL